MVWELRKILSWLLVPLLAAAFAALPWLVARRAGRGERGSGSGTAAAAFGCLGAVIGLGVMVCWWVYSAYLQDRAYMEGSRIVTGPVPEVAARAPYLVGAAQAAPHLGDVTGEIFDITYLPTPTSSPRWLSGVDGWPGTRSVSCRTSRSAATVEASSAASST